MTQAIPYQEMLHREVIRWIFKQGWSDLRDIQKRSIQSFFQSEEDLVIAAPTASGKTEAALLPILSSLIDESEGSVRLLWISPLKALINDTYQRFELICDSLGVEVQRWHGDVSSSAKKKLVLRPRGILLITPESLEAICTRRTGDLFRLFQFLQWVVIDELHVFLATERGRQLISLLHRLAWVIQQRPRRLGLSATLGDLIEVARIMSQGSPCQILEDRQNGGNLRLQLNVVLDPKNEAKSMGDSKSPLRKISKSLFKHLRGRNHLVFANSRRNVEELANYLRKRSEKERVPQEFFPHHGNLSKEFREDVEALLKKGNLPHTAICTSTLELGIDIGHVHSIAQIGCAPSVASLRQRLGRSGRRGAPPTLRGYVIENEVAESVDGIRPSVYQMIAMIELMLDGWNEPPGEESFSFSTLVHQILAVIYQFGGASIADIYELLCSPRAAFHTVAKADFILLLRHLKQIEVIQQMSDGTVLLAEKGEKITDHYSFFAVFATGDEYRLEANGKHIGSVPISHSLFVQKFMVFAGSTWRIIGIDETQKLILLTPAPGGKPPRFEGGGIWIHDEIRRKMKLLYTSDRPTYLTRTAASIFDEGQRQYQGRNLMEESLLKMGQSAVLFPWVGDRIMNTLTLIFAQLSNVVWSGPALIFEKEGVAEVSRKIENLLKEFPQCPLELAEKIENKKRQKFDNLVPDLLLTKGLAKHEIDLEGAKTALVRCF